MSTHNLRLGYAYAAIEFAFEASVHGDMAEATRWAEDAATALAEAIPLMKETAR